MKLSSHWLILALLIIAGAASAVTAAVMLSGGVHASRVAFPSSLGNAQLIRTRVELMDAVRLETWKHPSGLSYSFRIPFESQRSAGEILQCRVGLEGWLRTVSGHRNLLDLYCVCERPQLHHDRETSCPGLP